MFDYDYKYGIKAKLIVTEKNAAGSVLYQVEDDLLPEVSKYLKDSTTFNINEKIDVDYKKYNDLVTDFKKDYTLSVDSNLYIEFYIVMNGGSKVFTKDITNTQKMSATIPMAKQTISIDTDYTGANNSNYIDQVVRQDSSTVIYFALAALSILMVISSVIWTLRSVIKQEASKTYYERYLAKIMHDYNQIIVNSKVLPNLEEYDVVEVESFDEILDAKNNTDKSIVFYEIEEKELAAFLAIDTKVVYVYYLKNQKVVDKK